MNSHQRRIKRRTSRANSKGVLIGNDTRLSIGTEGDNDLTGLNLHQTFYERYKPGTIVTVNGIRHRVMALDIEPDPSKELTMQFKLERLPEQ